MPLRRLAPAFAVLCLLSLAAPVAAQVIEGTARVVDGDTLAMGNMRIRLAHIDAPEASQTCERADGPWACGGDATAELAAIVGDAAISCTIFARDVYGRGIATCRTPVFDLGREMVRRGMAITLDDAPFAYGEARDLAKRMGAGLWSGSFIEPAVWRRANKASAPSDMASRRGAASTQAHTSRRQGVPERVYRNEYGCTIKGNRSRRGDWIYHLPGRPYYSVTRAEEMFCTESEARAAGYRKSRA